MRVEIPVGYADDRMTFSDLQAIIRRRHFTFSLTLLGVLAGVAAFVFLSPPTYTARSVVMVPSVQDSNMPVAASGRLGAEDEMRIATTVELLKSPKVTEQLVIALAHELGHDKGILTNHAEGRDADALELRQVSDKSLVAAAAEGGGSDAAASGDAASTDPISLRAAMVKIQNQTTVRRVDSSRLIEIVATTRDPDLAVRIANSLPEVFVDLRRQETNRDRRKKIDRLDVQLKKAEEKVYEANLAVAKYMRDKNMLSPEGAQTVQSRVSSLEVALANTQAEGYARRVNALLDEQKALQKRLSDLAVTYGPGYPEIVGLQQQLAALEIEIASEKERVGVAAQSRRDELDATASVLSREVRQMRSKHFDDLEASAGLQKLEREARAAADMMDQLLDQLIRAQNELGNDVYSLETVSRAVDQDGSGGGQVLKKLGVGLIGAWVLAVFAALVAEGLDNKVRSADQIRAFLRSPTLALIPKVNSKKLAPNSLEAYLEKDPTSDFAESVRNLYLELMSQGPMDKQRVVVITSVKAGDGKSTIGTALVAIAEAFGVPSRVVEFDRRFEFGPGKMKSGVEIDASAVSVPERDGARGGAGSTPSKVRPVDDATWSAASSPLLPAQLSELKDRRGLVIIEAPPILKSKDAKALAATATDVIIVLEWGAVSPGALRAIRKAFGRTEISAVLNRVNFKEHARRGYGDTIDFAAKYA